MTVGTACHRASDAEIEKMVCVSRTANVRANVGSGQIHLLFHSVKTSWSYFCFQYFGNLSVRGALGDDGVHVHGVAAFQCSCAPTYEASLEAFENVVQSTETWFAQRFFEELSV